MRTDPPYDPNRPVTEVLRSATESSRRDSYITSACDEIITCCHDMLALIRKQAEDTARTAEGTARLAEALRTCSIVLIDASGRMDMRSGNDG